MSDDPMLPIFPHDLVFFSTMIGVILLVAAVVVPISLWRYDRKQKNKHRYLQ